MGEWGWWRRCSVDFSDGMAAIYVVKNSTVQLIDYRSDQYLWRERNQ